MIHQHDAIKESKFRNFSDFTVSLGLDEKMVEH